MVRIEFSNGSVIEYPEKVDVTRGKMSNYIWLVNNEEDEENSDSE